MRKRHAVIGGVIIGSLVTAYLGAYSSTAARNGLSLAEQQDPSDEVQTSTMRPVIRGRSMAAASMKPARKSDSPRRKRPLSPSLTASRSPARCGTSDGPRRRRSGSA